MKSGLYDDRYIIECKCADPQHLLIVDLYGYKEGEGSIDIYFCSNYKDSLWSRIKSALKFIFNKDSFLTSDSVWITKENIKHLEEVIKAIKECKNEV